MDHPVEEVRVELVPLIDVVFCILIFFILAAVSFSRQQAISIDLPKASNGTPQGRELLVVSLNELGQVYVEQQPVATKKEFLQKLQTYRQQNPNGVMALYASTNSSYNDVVQVLDLLREVGGDRVALATLPGDASSTKESEPTLPSQTGVPGYTPYQGANPYPPSGTPNPGNAFNPAAPQVPVNPGQQLQPGLPGANPRIPQGLPGQTPVIPGSLAVPSPGAPVSPKTNSAVPGNSAVPSPGTAPAKTNSAAPGNSAVPSSGAAAPAKTENAAPKR
jgi:biopolymer transport protein ExbD